MDKRNFNKTFSETRIHLRGLCSPTTKRNPMDTAPVGINAPFILYPLDQAEFLLKNLSVTILADTPDGL